MSTSTSSSEFTCIPGASRTAIHSVIDVVTARQRGRSTAAGLGFAATDITLIAAAISEVSRNIVDHAQQGEVAIGVVAQAGRRGIRISACDQGPGIDNVAQAIAYGHPSRRRLGMGLPGARWLMDEFDIVSSRGRGTVVTMTKWMSPDIGQAHAA